MSPIEVLLNEARIAISDGNFETALANCLTILDTHSGHPEALKLAAQLSNKTGKLDQAKNYYQQAIALWPQQPEFRFGLGIVFLKQNKYDPAEAAFLKALAIDARYVRALVNLGAIAYHKHQYEQALQYFNQALALEPGNASAYINRGNCHQRKGNAELAANDFEKAIELNGADKAAHYNLGNLKLSLKENDKALVHYEEALKIDPCYAEAYFNKALIYYNQKKYELAVEFYLKAIQNKKDYIDAYINIAVALFSLNKPLKALQYYQVVIQLDPTNFTAYANMGNTLRKLRRRDDAVKCYQHALKLNDKLYEAHYNVGQVYRELHQYAQSIHHFERALEIKPDYEYLHGVLIYTKLYSCDWHGLDQMTEELLENIKLGKKVSTTFPLFIITGDEKLHLKSAQIWLQDKHYYNPLPFDPPKTARSSKIKLGFYSADFRFHPVSLWLAEQIDHHDRDKFELYAFSYRNDNKDPMHMRMREKFDHFYEVDQLSDSEVVKLSRQVGIDIALDLGGDTQDSRPDIFAMRAAPIQINHLGFPGSFGSDYTDFIITDEHAIPKASQPYYTEKIIYVPCNYTYDTKRQLTREPMTRADFDLPENGFVFTCQNGNQKITHQVFEIWMRLLKNVPGSVLWLLLPNATALANLRKEAKIRGVDPDRMIFTKRDSVPVAKEYERIGRYLASYKLADLFLDTLPYNAGTTAVDALWAGLPVITQTGSAQVGRMATSILHAIELPELVTKTAAAYEALALDLALNPDKLNHIKSKLEQNRHATALFDVIGNTRHIENAYIQIFNDYSSGKLHERSNLTA
jgi:predicted O-linked N-acetylglucosamine transferase (SPINDLY family)